MAISYSTVFAHFGKIVSKSNSYNTIAATTLPADLQAIVAAYGTGSTSTGDAQGPISGITNTYSGFQSAIVGWRQSLDPYCKNTLTDYDTVTSQLVGLKSSSINDVLAAIIQDMSDNSQTVKGCTVTLGSVTAGSGNIGNGTAFADKVLDGYSSPVRSGFATIRYNGINSELAVPSETMQLTCTSDSFTGGATEGSESWTWVGGQQFGLLDYHTEGSGQGPGLTTANGDTTITDLGFENWTNATTPSNWTIATGSTTINRESTTAKVYRGTYAMRFTGDGSNNPSINQSVSRNVLKSRRRYLFTIRLFADGSAPGAGTLTIKFTGTGYTAASNEKISVALTALTGSYVLYSFYWNTPSTLPSDLKIDATISGGTLASGANIYLDSGSFSPVVYSGGVNAVIVAGSTPWTVGDRLTFTVANDQAGIFNTYVRRAYNCQLPSKTDGSQTISDALAS